MHLDIKKHNFLDIIFSRNLYFYSFIVFLIFKAIPKLQSFSLITYFIYLYGGLYFIYHRLYKKIELTFPCCYFSYGIIVVSIISVLINGYTNLKSTIIDIIPFFINFFVIFPSFKDDNFASLDKLFIKISQVILIIGTFFSIVNVIFYIMNIYDIFFIDNTKNYLRMRGILGNPNLVGWFSIVYLGTILYLKNNIIKKRKPIYIFLIVLSIICLSFSNCRSAYLAVFVYFLFYLLTIKSVNEFFNNHRYIIFFVFLILISGFLVILLFSRNSLGSGRLSLYRYAIHEYLNNNLFFGLGYGKIKETWTHDYFEYFKERVGNNIIYYYRDANSHNIFLQQLCVNGAVGFILICTFVINLIKKILHYIFNYKYYSDNEHKLFNSCCYYIITSLVIGMFDNCIILSILLFTNFMFLISSSIILKCFEDVETK